MINIMTKRIGENININGKVEGNKMDLMAELSVINVDVIKQISCCEHDKYMIAKAVMETVLEQI